MTKTVKADVKWLLLVFTLPASKASERVQMWRKLQRFGAIPFRNAGSLLPNTPENQERFEWLATAIRESKGEASVLLIQPIDDLSCDGLQDQFRTIYPTSELSSSHTRFTTQTGKMENSSVMKATR